MKNPASGLAAELAQIALRAGDAIMDHYETGVSVERKSDASPVTEADRRGEEIILEGLGKLAPGIPTLAEEAASAGDTPNLDNDPETVFFLVDPLDGTKEFINGSGEFTVNIALIRGGAPELGVVLAPALGEIFLGVAGEGARRASTTRGEIGEWSKIESRRPAPARLTAMGSRSHGSSETQDFLDRLPIESFAAAGSSLKFCRLAEGAADVYPRFGRTMEWDTGAGQAVLEAAGGAVFVAGSEHAPLRYAKAARGYDNPHFVAWGDPAHAKTGVR
ncbi:MAG: 3'(2'),5'-bisphosphate nucleotidase CysQ [Pseudomonadota bacterium]